MVYVNQQQQNNDTSLGTNLSWRTPIAIIDGSYSHSKNAWQSGGSISSGLVVWPGGINITNQLSDTFAILDAPGLEGAHINGQKYNRTNSKGQVVYNLIIPHRENHLVLDIANSESETELQGNGQLLHLTVEQFLMCSLQLTNVSPGVCRHCVPMVRH